MDNQLNAIQSQISGINKGMEKIERNVEKVSEGMIQLVEFRKEAEFINQKVKDDRNRLIHLEGVVDGVKADVAGQKTSNRIWSSVLGFVGSVSLAVGLYMAGANSKLQDRIQDMDKNISVLQSILAKGTVSFSFNEGHK